MKDPQVALDTWRGLSALGQDGYTVQMCPLYRLKVVLMKTLAVCGVGKLVVKFMWKMKPAEIARETRETARGTSPLQ